MIHFTIAILFALVLSTASLVSPAHAMIVTELELTGGSVNSSGRFNHVLDRLLGQDGTVSIGQYQAIGEIVPSVTKRQQTFSLFTSGLNGAPAPFATIDGFSISVDLSSLFFGVSRGDSLQIWNIGGLAGGVFNPETSEFFLSWDHHSDLHKRAGHGTFFLKGKVEVAPIPIPASLVLYATGMFGLGSWAWWRRHAS